MKETHYCIVCNKTHEDHYWTKVEGTEDRYCHHGIQCAGCKKLHYNHTYRTLMRWVNGVKREYCGEWYKSSVSMEKKMENLSPQEVLSGVQYGLPEQKVFSNDATSKDWGEGRVEAVKELGEELSQ